MRNFNLLFYGIAILIITAGCKSYSKTSVTTDVSGPTVVQKPVIADLDVEENRVIGTASGKGSESIDVLKQNALNNALDKSKADVLVEPRYEIITSRKQSTVNVSGYPATYKNFRPMVVSDTIFVGKTTAMPATSPRVMVKNNKRTLKIVGMSIGGFFSAVLIAGLVAWLF